MARDGTAIMFGPGSAFVDVTTAGWGSGDGTAPYGGTNIGYLEGGMVVMPGYTTAEQRGEDFGVELHEEIYLGMDWRVLITPVQHDATSYDLAFPELTRDSSDVAQARLHDPGPDSGDGSLLIGAALSAHARVFVYVPDDPYGDVFIAHNAVIHFAEGGQQSWADDEVRTLPLTIKPMRDTTLTTGSDDAYPYRKVYCGPRTGAVVGT